ncbi:MAG TPA: glycosyltransferase [Pyrinomonadaceae bacterium]|nr:glycosyltransferase [Pyrinomonadaceae bacterium]
MSSSPRPLISIITATYNRSNVLSLAIESVRWQTFRDWELWVVGDACTDDTEETIAAYGDPRIHFINLKDNVGEQSGPNNEGFRRALGRYIAYLNHDDLWLPDHLEAALEEIEKTGADLVFTLVDTVMKAGKNSLGCAAPSMRYEPGLLVPASCWLLRRELAEEVGPWRFYRECYSIPSQDWLYRAWKAGKDLRLVARMTVVAITSGTRRGVYANREAWENQLYFERIRDEPDFRARELTSITLNYETPWLRWYPAGTLVLRALRNLLVRACVAARLDPIAVRNFFLYFRKGKFIDRLRRIRGLEPLGRERGLNRERSSQ